MIKYQDFDHSIFDQFAKIFDSRIMPGVIGLEGIPFAGKTTFAENLASTNGGIIIPEHTDFDLHARNLALSPWPENSTSAIARQNYFYFIEHRRAVAASYAVKNGSQVVMDRTALSVVVYSLTRAATGSCSFKNIYDLKTISEDSGIRFPETLYLLLTPTDIALKRAMKLSDAGTPRSIESFFLDSQNLKLMNNFYEKITSRLHYCKVIIKYCHNESSDIGIHRSSPLSSENHS
ncbi:MAG: hypothetical protein WCL46_07345 [Chlorobium sp.]|jgi:thymidylate kinase